jgi:hypothetical protein
MKKEFRRIVVSVQRFLEIVGQSLKTAALYRIPRIDRWGAYLPLSFALICYGWWELYPVLPGYCIAALAFAAVIMTVRADKFTPAERIIWVIIGACLMVAETRVLYLDRVTANRERDAANAIQETRFETTVEALQKTIKNSQEQFKATMGGMEGILSKQDQTLMQTMGGTGYPLFIASLPTDPTSKEMSVHVITPGKFYPHGHIPTPQETAPLSDVTVDLTEQPLRIEDFTQSEIESVFHPTHYMLGTVVVPATFTAPFKLQEGKRYTLQITTRRGEFREDIYTRRDASAPGGWRESWCMYGRQTVYKHGTVTSEEKLLDGKCD